METFAVVILLGVFIFLFVRSTKKNKSVQTPKFGGGGDHGGSGGQSDVVNPKTDSPTNEI
jgi:hypothetical protein